MSEPISLRLERTFPASPATVYTAWTEQEALQRWSAPKGFTITKAGGEMQVGGAWHCTMRSPEGEELTVIGTYREMVPAVRLSFTHQWVEDDGSGKETMVTIQFAEDDAATRMTFEQTGFRSEGSRDGHREGWSEAFDKLAEYLAP